MNILYIAGLTSVPILLKLGRSGKIEYLNFQKNINTKTAKTLTAIPKLRSFERIF